MQTERTDSSRRAARAPGTVTLMILLAAASAAPALAQGYGGTVDDILARGDILLSQERPTEAIIQFQEVRTLCPTPPQMVESLRGEARARAAMGELLQAAGLYEEAAAVFPDDPRVPDLLYAAGSSAYRGGDLPRAGRLLQRSLDSSPTSDLEPRVKFRLSQALRLQGQHARVIELLGDFEESHEKNVLLPNVLYTIAIAHHDLGDLASSEASYRRLIEEFPGTTAAVEAHYELGQVLAESGRPREATRHFRQYVDLNPGSPIAAKAYERAGDMLLFRSPRESAELYALARVKAKTNPEPGAPAMRPGRWLGLKSALAGFLARTWLLGILGVLLIGGIVLLVWILARARRRKAAPAA